ncbi:hypothetical protein JCM11957_09350 [Caminibacter profundus]
MQYFGLIIGLILGIYGLVRIDYVLYMGLNYFGKYVFFGLFNIFTLYFFWFFYKKFSGWLQIVMPAIYGFIILLVSFKLV